MKQSAIKRPLSLGGSNKTLFKNSLILSIGGLLAKILGAIYRIPLTNLLKSTGIGLYQMVFPVYCLLLDFSGASVPSALSKTISESDNTGGLKLLKNSLILLFFLGLVCSVLMAVLSRPISILQGNANASIGYVFLAPSVTVVAVISCFRGYFQGKLNNVPTAISQIIEQAVKLILGLVLVSFLINNIPFAVGGATLAVTVSEVFALVFLIIVFKKETSLKGVKNGKGEFIACSKILIKTAFPIMLSGLIIPLSQVIDSFLIINILKSYEEYATGLYGLFSGAVSTVINLPVAVCYGVAAATIPLIAKARANGDFASVKKGTGRAITYTLLMAIPAAVFCYFFAPFITNFLFRSLSAGDKLIVINLLRISAVNIVLLSLVQTTNAILIGRGNIYIPVINLTLGVVVKTVLNVVLLQKQSVGIYGAAVALISCYLVAVLFNLLYIISINIKEKSAGENDRQAKTA